MSYISDTLTPAEVLNYHGSQLPAQFKPIFERLVGEHQSFEAAREILESWQFEGMPVTTAYIRLKAIAEEWGAT